MDSFITTNVTTADRLTLEKWQDFVDLLSSCDTAIGRKRIRDKKECRLYGFIYEREIECKQ